MEKTIKAIADLWLLETIEHHQNCDDENCELWHRFTKFLQRYSLTIADYDKLKLAILRPE